MNTLQIPNLMQVFETGQGFYAVRLDKNHRSFLAIKSALKRINNRKWDEINKVWIVPAKEFATGQHLHDYLQEAIAESDRMKKLREMGVQPLPDLTIDIPLKKEMYPFQKKGTAYCLEKGRVIIGDQQGLGKTIQALAAVEAVGEFPGLVICKNSLRVNWQDEISAWTNRSCLILTDSVKHSWPSLLHNKFFEICIVNYEGLAKYFVKRINTPDKGPLRLRDIDFFDSIGLFKWVIVDESHYVKDTSRKRTKFTAGICKGKKHIYLLSGTPALNHPKEIYTQICIIEKDKHFGGSPEAFKRMYCGQKNRGNLKLLNRLLWDQCYYRRTKMEVVADMPRKTRRVILCDIDNREEYSKAENNFRGFLRDNLMKTSGQITRALRAEALVQMNELKKLAAVGKLGAVREWVESLLDQDEKMVLFAFHKKIQDEIASFAPGAAKLGGGRTAEEVKDAKDRFMNDPSCPLIVCSISADSEGHTLTAASNLGMVELPWHFGKAEQCEDRIHRIGTKFPVNIDYFVADGTVDRQIYKLIMSKKEMHDDITGTDEQVEQKIIDNMINLFK